MNFGFFNTRSLLGGDVGMSGGGYVQGYVQGGVGMSPPDMGAKRVLTPPWTWGTIGYSRQMGSIYPTRILFFSAELL